MEPCDHKIIEMRKDNARLSTIREYLSGYPTWSMIDEGIQLAHCLSILDAADMAVSRKEIKTAFNKFYKEQNQRDKKGYLNWYYRAFHVKKGVKVQTSQSRAFSQKMGVVSTNTHNLSVGSENEVKMPQYALQNTAVAIGNNITQSLSHSAIDCFVPSPHGKERNKESDSSSQRLESSSLRTSRGSPGRVEGRTSPAEEVGFGSAQELNRGAENENN